MNGKKQSTRVHKVKLFCSPFQSYMNLPPDKLKLLSQYDNEKKWELVCDQVRHFTSCFSAEPQYACHQMCFCWHRVDIKYTSTQSGCVVKSRVQCENLAAQFLWLQLRRRHGNRGRFVSVVFTSTPNNSFRCCALLNVSVFITAFL